MSHRINKAFMDNLEARALKGFSELATVLRQEVACTTRERLGRAMGYGPNTAYAVVQNIETGRRTAGLVSVRNYLDYFQGLDITFVARLVGQDRARYLLRQLRR